MLLLLLQEAQEDALAEKKYVLLVPRSQSIDRKSVV